MPDRWMRGWMARRVIGREDGWVNGWMNSRLIKNGYMGACVSGWMDMQMHGFMHECTDGQAGEWMEGETGKSINLCVGAYIEDG